MDVAERFQQETEPYLSRPGVTRSTMMGFPCVRFNGKFFASFNRKTGNLLVKLPAARVDQLTEEGRGVPFSPAGRRFREWVGIAGDDGENWSSLLDEALQFAGS
jgi:hypothetical protein